MDLTPSRELVLKKLKDSFPDTKKAAEALALLETYGTQSWQREKDRVQLAVLKLSKGSLDLLRHNVDCANLDHRDVLMWSEYPEEGNSSPQTSAEEKKVIRMRDRKQYEDWLQSEEA